MHGIETRGICDSGRDDRSGPPGLSESRAGREIHNSSPGSSIGNRKPGHGRVNQFLIIGEGEPDQF